MVKRTLTDDVMLDFQLDFFFQHLFGLPAVWVYSLPKQLRVEIVRDFLAD